jgi:hypothetical protein
MFADRRSFFVLPFFVVEKAPRANGPVARGVLR